MTRSSSATGLDEWFVAAREPSGRSSDSRGQSPPSERLEGMPWIGETGQLLTAAGLGSILGSLITQFISRGAERRALRAKVRQELSTVEQLRWAKDHGPHVRRSPEDPAALEQSRDAKLAAAWLRLQTAAMMAHLPRGIVEEYDHLALAAHQSSKESLADRQVASVPRPVSECVEAAYQLICDLLWHPVLTRLTYRPRLKKLQRLVRKNGKTEAGANLRWAYDEARSAAVNAESHEP